MYKVLLSKQADKKRRKLPLNIRNLIKEKLYILELWKFEILDIKKLQWEENLYRLRIGKYRVIFEKQDKKLIIFVIDIGSRWDIYK